MSPRTTSFTPAAEPIPRWSSTGHTSARHHSCPRWLSTPHTSQRAIVMAAPVKSSGPAGNRNHPAVITPRRARTPSTAVKSP